MTPGDLVLTPVLSPVLRIASVPEGHVYVRHLSAADGSDRVRRLPDPPPLDADATPGQWWPPAMLSAGWVRAHQAEFDIFHIHFGFDALEASDLAALVAELRRWDKPLVYTVHDLQNPHHTDTVAHDSHLNVLIPAAAALVTLTPGAAAVIEERWGRKATVIPHPHIVDFDRMALPTPARGDEFVIGVHAKSVRASMDPQPVIQALVSALPELPHSRLQVNIHRDVFDEDGRRHDPVLAGYLRRADRLGRLDLRVHDCFTDDELWEYFEGLDVSVLPYRFGTHSGWLEACFDLGTTVLAPSCGFYAEQQRVLTFSMDQRGLDGDSLQQALRSAYVERPHWQASVADRRRQRDGIAAGHRALYHRVLSERTPR